MDAQVRQDTRLLRLATVLGSDALLATSLDGVEGLSRLFSYTVGAVAQKEIEAARLLGEPAVLTLTRARGDDQHFHGIVRSVDLTGYDETARTYNYTLTLVPWFWLLTRRTDSRIFQDRSVRQIAEEIFREHGFSDFSLELGRDPPARPYCVQYRESSFAFLSRLFEEEGIFYFFRHGQDRHTMVLADAASSHPEVPAGGMNYDRADFASSQDSVFGWVESLSLTAGRVALADFDYRRPQSSLQAETSIQGAPPSAGDLELYDHPGRFLTQGEGDRAAGLKAAVEEVGRQSFQTGSNAPALRAGVSFTLKGHPLAAANRRYTVVAAGHSATNNLGEGGAGYANRLELIDNGVTFRPPRSTPRPIVEGAQTATVVGPPGEEIHTDELGRIKVRFHWDRRAKNDAAASCWVRVAQSSAGVRWGGFWLPRVGMEVLVEFLDGDPDRPLVNGVVYNGANLPPYPLPERATVSAFKTLSSPGGGGFNELSFDDGKGKEQVFLHAQSRLDVRVRGAAYESVGGGRHQTVGGNRVARVEEDEHLLIKGDRAEAVEGGDSLEVGDDLQVRVGGDHLARVGGELVIRAGSAITLRVGGSMVRIDGSGVVVRGPRVRINSGGGGGNRSASPAKPKEPVAAASGTAGALPQPGAPGRLARLTARRGRVAQTDAFREAARTGAALVESCPAAGAA